MLKGVLQVGALILALLGAGAAAGADGKVSGTIPVDKTFVPGSFDWNGKPAYEFLWRPIVVNGKIEICGAGVHRDIYYKTATRKALKEYQVEMGNKVILSDIRFFAKVPHIRDRPKAQTNCRATGAANPSREMSIRLTVRSRYGKF